jgi:Flp pilus assembly protein TadG
MAPCPPPCRAAIGRARAAFVRRRAHSWGKNASGVAGIEFALIVSFLAVAGLNVTDLAVFLFDKLQVNEATQMGAQAAWATCDLNHIPATNKCPGMSSAVTAAVQATSLGTSVQLLSGSPSEGYYCVSTTGVLTYVSDVNSPPSDCSTAGSSTTVPADYVEVQTTFTYAPIFAGISIGSTLPTTITSTSWVMLSV